MQGSMERWRDGWIEKWRDEKENHDLHMLVIFLSDVGLLHASVCMCVYIYVCVCVLVCVCISRPMWLVPRKGTGAPDRGPRILAGAAQEESLWVGLGG